jgi:transposase
MPRGHATPIELTDEERETLQRNVRRRTSASALSMRSRIVLLAADGLTNKQIAPRVGACAHTVGVWRSRFVRERLDGLYDEPRVGRPRDIDDARIEEVVVKTLESTPRGATHWSTRSMAKNIGLSQSSIGRIWRAFGLKPHRTETFQLSKDPQLVGKVRDIVGLYLSPPENAAVFCVDEKTCVQALERAQPLLPLRPGQPERRTHDYERHGSLDLFAALEVATGKVLARTHERHRSVEFVRFLDAIEANVPAGREVHLVLDNLSTHKTPRVHRWLIRHPRFKLHFTPTKGSWLNQVERWFGGLTDRQLRRGSHRSKRELREAIEAYIAATNDRAQPFVWLKSADEILQSIARFAHSMIATNGLKPTSDSGH